MIYIGIFKLFDAIKDHRDAFHMKGIGLGLTITKKLVHSLDGEITLLSEVNKGTEVSITIPYFKRNYEEDSINEEFDQIVQFTENKKNMQFETHKSPFQI